MEGRGAELRTQKSVEGSAVWNGGARKLTGFSHKFGNCEYLNTPQRISGAASANNSAKVYILGNDSILLQLSRLVTIFAEKLLSIQPRNGEPGASTNVRKVRHSISIQSCG
jgi:hypothetical protein